MLNSSPRVLVTGSAGQLGLCLQSLSSEKLDVAFADRASFDLANKDQMQVFLEQEKPKIVVNCAAYTNVDGAESELSLASSINHSGVVDLATLCAERRIKIIHISTDFVFNGEAKSPYRITDTCSPLSVYGQTKLRGESSLRQLLPEESMVIRTSWLYSEFGGNFVKTMLKLFESKDSFQVVQDQQGAPTYALGLANLIWHIVENDGFSPGIYHWCDNGVTTWYDFANEIGTRALEIGVIKRKAAVLPIMSSEYGAVAPRPTYSALDCLATTEAYPLVKQIAWQDSLAEMLHRYSKNLGTP